MQRKVYLIIFYLLLMSSLAMAQMANPKKGLKQIVKQDYEKLDKYLDKSISKNPYNPSAYYLKALVQTDTSYYGFDLVQSNESILYAIDLMDSISEKDINKLAKQRLTLPILEDLKEVIDSLNFEIAQDAHSVAAYQDFIDRHRLPEQLDVAISARNALAFSAATQADTYQSYKAFMDRYPDADEYQEAESRYEKLLFDNQIADRRLESYEAFLKQYPNTPYRKEAEKNILEIKLSANDPQAMLDFIQQYPQSVWKRKAQDIAYHSLLAKDPEAKFLSMPAFASVRDSLQNSLDLTQGFLLINYEKGAYGFMDQSGRTVLENQFKEIFEDYKCDKIVDDFLLTGDRRDAYEIRDRDGHVIYAGPVIDAEDLGYGLIKIREKNAWGVIHKSGYRILESSYSEIELIHPSLFRVVKNGQVGLRAFSGREIYPPQFDDILVRSDFVIFERAGRIAVTNVSQLLSIVNQVTIKLTFSFEDFELLSPQFLQVFDQDREGVLDANLQEEIPIADHLIYPIAKGWIIREGDRYFVDHEDMINLRSKPYEQLVRNKNWLGLKSEGKWTLLDQQGSMFPQFDYDSLQMLGEQLVILHKADSTFGFFEKGVKASLTGNINYQIANTQGVSGGDILVATNVKGFKRVFNQFGRQIIAGEYSQVTAIGGNLLVLDKQNKKALIDSTGKTLLPLKYDGIGKLEKGIIPIFLKGKFGAYHLASGKIIEPAYDGNPEAINEQVIAVNKGGKIGLIDPDGKKIADFEFSEIKTWNDSTVLAKTNDSWLIFDLKTGQKRYEGIENISFVKDEKEKLIIFYKNRSYGVLSNVRGELIEPTYNDIFNIGSEEEPVFFAEKRIEGLYVVLYLNYLGERMAYKTYTQEDYDKILCD